MGSRGGEHAPGQSLPLGWEGTREPSTDEDSRPETPSTATDRTPPLLRRILAIGAALVVVMALTVALPRLLTVTIGPELAVTDFLQAVVDGDIAQVREHTRDSSEASGAALTTEMMRQVTGGIESFEIQDVHTRGGTANVTALLHSRTSSGAATFTLTAASDSPFAPVTWSLEPIALPEVALDMPFAVGELSINGIDVPLEELTAGRESAARQIAVQLLPGRYEISPILAGPWRAVSPLTVEVPLTFGGWHGTVEASSIELTASAQAQLSRLVDEHLRSCLTATAEQLKGCPVPVAEVEAERAEDGEDAAGGAWELAEDPMLEIEPSVNGVKWLVHGVGAARPASSEGADPAETVPVHFYGDFYLTGAGEMRYRPENPDGTISHFYTTCFDRETGEMSAITRSVLEAGIWRREGERCE